MDKPNSAMIIKQPATHQEGRKITQYFVSIVATLMAFNAGTILAWTAPALPVLESANSPLNCNITESEASWIGSLAAVGALCGALPSGYISETFGRKLPLLALGIPSVISWAMKLQGTSLEMLYAARLIGGFTAGAASGISPMYIGEIAESSIRGTLGTFFQLMLTVGILYVYVVGTFFSYKSLQVMCGIIPVVFMLLFLKAPDSPTYLLKKGRRHDAEKALRFLRGPSYDIHTELNNIQYELDKASRQKVSFAKAIMKKASLKSLFISLGLMLFQQFSGVNAVIFYSVSIFQAAGSTLDPSICTVIIGVVQVIVTYFSAVLVDKAGRRILLLISSSVMALCLGCLGYYFHLQQKGEDVSNIGMVPLVSVCIFIVVFSLGFGPIPWLMTGELFSGEIKGFASSLAVTLNWTSTFILTKTFQSFLTTIGADWTFWVLALICSVGTVFVFLFVIETKGKSLEEIQCELAGKPYIPNNENDKL